jgi:hypothetical protein
LDPEFDSEPDPFVRGADPDPHQNVADSQHCKKVKRILLRETRIIAVCVILSYFDFEHYYTLLAKANLIFTGKHGIPFQNIVQSEAIIRGDLANVRVGRHCIISSRAVIRLAIRGFQPGGPQVTCSSRLVFSFAARWSLG